MKATLAILVSLALALPAGAQQAEGPKIVEETEGNITRAHVEGSLAPTQAIDCVLLSEARNTLTPPDLHTGLSKCIGKGEFVRAARLFVLAGVYARFDAERVADRTARAGGQVLILRTFAAFTQEQKQAFSREFDRITKDPLELQSTCAVIRNIGPPNYFPKYLVLHGVEAFSSPSPLKNALVPDFEPSSTWARLQSTYLHCPA